MIPATALAHLIATRTGQGVERTQRDRAQWSRCERCRGWLLAGLDDEFAALAVACDPTPLDRRAEAVAWTTGRPTYDLHLIPAPRLRLRTAGQIAHQPADPAAVLVLPAHACGQPLAPTITLHRRQEPSHDACPY